jgi:hypothetical protein
MYDAQQPLLGAHHRKRHDAVLLHEVDGRGSQRVRFNYFWIPVHHLIDHDIQKALRVALHEPGQIPGRDDARDLLVTIDDRDRASLLSQQHDGRTHGRAQWQQRHTFRHHDIAHPQRELPSQRATRVQPSEVIAKASPSASVTVVDVVGARS